MHVVINQGVDDRTKIKRIKIVLLIAFSFSLVGAVCLLVAQATMPDWSPVFVLLISLGNGSSFVV
jgi:fatty acid desaturase